MEHAKPTPTRKRKLFNIYVHFLVNQSIFINHCTTTKSQQYPKDTAVQRDLQYYTVLIQYF